MALKETKNIFEAVQQYHEEIVKPKVAEVIDSTSTRMDTIVANAKAVDERLNNDLAHEASVREIADHNLNVRVDEETLARITRDIELTNYMNSEITRLTEKTERELHEGLTQEAHKRIDEDNLIRDAILNETNLRTAEYNKMFNALEEEKNARKKADADNLATIRQELSDAITTENARAELAEQTLQEHIDKSIDDLDKKFEQALSAEHDDRVAKLDAEAATRLAEDIALANAINDENVRSVAAEAALATSIFNESVERAQADTDLANSLATETSRRTEADNKLTQDLAAEIANRTTADNTLTTVLTTKINSDIADTRELAADNLAAAVEILNSTINQNVLDLSDKIDILEENIRSESTSRLEAESSLGQRLVQETTKRLEEDAALAAQMGQDKTEVKTLVYRLQDNIVDESIARTQAIAELKTNLELADVALKAQIDEVEAKRAASAVVTADNNQRLANINLMIPAEANLANKLADKAYVEDLVATESSVFIGTFDTLEEIEAIKEAKNNSYAFHKTADGYSRYKFIAAEDSWKFEYALNNTSFTAEQWAAINSNVTAGITDQVKSIEDNLAKEVSDREDADALLSARVGVLEESSANNIELNNHKERQDNPHGVTAAQVGLGNVQNLPIDPSPVADSGNYITSGAVAALQLDIYSQLYAHTQNGENPHYVTKSQVGLSRVENKSMDEVPSDTDNYVRSRGIKAAIDAVQANLNAHTDFDNGNTNPHQTTKGNVGLGSVENRPMDTVPTEDSVNYVTSGGVKTAINGVQSYLTAHKDASNPHHITKATVNLDKVVNARMDTAPIANSTNYISSGAVDAAIVEVKTLLDNATAAINTTLSTKITQADIPTHLDAFSNERTKYITAEEIPSMYITEAELEAKKYLTAVPAEYITETELLAKGYLTDHQDISGKVDRTELERVAFTGSYNDLFDKPILRQGEKGEQGIQGLKGDNGASAYQIAVANGFVGDEIAWLESLKGIPGTHGVDGVTPRIGENLNWWIGPVDTGVRAEGIQGIQGIQGNPGKDGKDGYTPVKGIDYFDGDKGDKGDKGDTGAAFTFEMFTPAQLASLKGDKGDKGDTGAKGDTGPSFLSGYLGQIGGTPKKGYITFVLGTNN